MLNNSLFDTLAVVDSVFEVGAEDFIVMAKVAVKWLFHSGGSFKGFTQDESSFIRLLNSRDEMGFFRTSFTDIKFAEAKGYIGHRMANKMNTTLMMVSDSDDQDDFEKIDSNTLNVLDNIIDVCDGISLDKMRQNLEFIDKDDTLDSE